MADIKLENLTELQRARVACRKILTQFPGFPEGRLMGAIVCGAVIDLVRTSDNQYEHKTLRRRAMAYIAGPMKHAELAGVEPAWIRTVLTQLNVDFSGEV